MNTVRMPRPGLRPKPIFLLLAVALGALLATGWCVISTPGPPPPSGGVASARVLATGSCTTSALDSISVVSPTGPVTTTLDGCGRPVGTTLTVDLNADGTVPSPAAVVGTRAERERSPLPVVVLGGCAGLVLALGVGALRGPSARAARQG